MVGQGVGHFLFTRALGLITVGVWRRVMFAHPEHQKGVSAVHMLEGSRAS